jgi:hypothetical protein
MKNIDQQIVLDFLNDLLTYDKDALNKLIETRVPCNSKLAHHETVQVVGSTDENLKQTYEVGFLGILNGLVGIHEESGYGYISAAYDDSNDNLLGFELHPKTIKNKQ